MANVRDVPRRTRRTIGQDWGRTVFSCPHGPKKDIFEWFLVVCMALQKNMFERLLAVHMALQKTFLNGF